MKKLLKWLPAIFLCGYIYYWSSIPGSTINAVGLGNETLHRITHFFLYFFLCLSFYLPTNNILAAILLTILYGLSDEYHQSFVPLRSASLFDIYTDTFGALSAGIIWKISRILLKKQKH